MDLKKTFFSSLTFFFVLSSWYSIRSVRNELAVENYGEGMLIPLLIATTICMLLVNPIYSWLVTKSNYAKIVFYTYSFFILNLIILYFYSISLNSDMTLERLWLGRIFYVWSNIYSFFTVAIFWVLVINIFRNVKSRKYYGFILAGGSAGAIFGSQISIWLSSSFLNLGLVLYLLSAGIFLLIAIILMTYMVNIFPTTSVSKKVGGASLDAFKNILSNEEIKLVATYSWFFTFLMTIQWISAIPIIDQFSSIQPERIKLFARIEQLVSPITLFIQLSLTYIVLSRFGIKFILFIYGLIFLLVFLLYGLVPSIGVVVFSQTLLRVFEYAFNKPAREILYSELNKNDRYKSTVFIDTFVTRFGDLSGSLFVGFGKIMFTTITYLPLVAIPFAFLHSIIGKKITKKKSFKDL